MIGYLAPYAPDPTQRQLYRSYQCGLCHTLGAEYGFAYRLFAGPDMVFLAVFRDLVGPGPAGVHRRACVLAPVVSSLPVRDRTDNTRFAAAFGVYMAVEKLRDDWQDEGGAHRWLAWRAFRPGWERARAELLRQDFPVAEVERGMREQARVEALPTATLEEAARPTRAIAALLFGHAARLAGEGHRPRLEALGRAVGGFLFLFDNLLDLPKDLRQGGYNALARAHGLVAEAPVPEPVVTAALDAAHQEVDRLAALLPELPVQEHGGFLSRSLVVGFRAKIRHYRALSPDGRARATLRTVAPPRARTVEPLADLLARSFGRVVAQVRLTLALLLTWAAPRSSWAARAWPTEGSPELEAQDTGLAAWLESGADSASDDRPASDTQYLCDPCCSNCGWVECSSERCCDDLCIW